MSAAISMPGRRTCMLSSASAPSGASSSGMAVGSGVCAGVAVARALVAPDCVGAIVAVPATAASERAGEGDAVVDSVGGSVRDIVTEDEALDECVRVRVVVSVEDCVPVREGVNEVGDAVALIGEGDS